MHAPCQRVYLKRLPVIALEPGDGLRDLVAACAQRVQLTQVFPLWTDEQQVVQFTDDHRGQYFPPLGSVQHVHKTQEGVEHIGARFSDGGSPALPVFRMGRWRYVRGQLG